MEIGGRLSARFIQYRGRSAQ